MWSLLLFGVVAAVTESQSIKLFGCTSEDVEYGKEVAPLNFNRRDVVYQFIQDIQYIYTDLLKTSVYNDLPPFFEFYDARKVFKGNITDFYNQYTARPDEESLSFKLLDRISSKHESVKNHSYLIEVSQGYGLKTMYKNHERNKPSNVDHVAAVIRISINKRQGVILMDMDSGFSVPVVLMEDGGAPHMYYIWYPNRIRFIRNILGNTIRKMDHFTLGHFEERSGSTSGQDHEFRLVNSAVVAERADRYARQFLPPSKVYYINRPYCSSKSWLKEKLTDSRRLILRRSFAGANIAAINFEFDLRMKGKNQKFNSKNLPVCFDKTKEKAIEFDDMEWSKKKHYNDVKINLLDYTNLTFTLKKAQEIAHDMEFMTEYYEILAAPTEIPREIHVSKLGPQTSIRSRYDYTPLYL